MKRKYWMQSRYWGALLNWVVPYMFEAPPYSYQWWKIRCKLIKEGQI